MTCPYCSKTLNAMGGLFIHMEVTPKEGNWNIDKCQKLQQEDAPRDKWAKILLRTKGNIREVKLQPRRYPHQPREKLCTKANDRRAENKESNRNKKRGKQQRKHGRETYSRTDNRRDKQQLKKTTKNHKQREKITQKELTQPKLTLQEEIQIEIEEGREQQTTKRNQPVRIIITPPEEVKTATSGRREIKPDASRLLAPIRKKPTKRTRKRKRNMHNRQHRKKHIQE